MRRSKLSVSEAFLATQLRSISLWKEVDSIIEVFFEVSCIILLLRAWFVVIFGINTTCDISKLLYVISRAVRRVKFETILKYHVQIMLLFVYTTTRKRFVIFTCRYFKLSWNTTDLSQSNCRNLSRSSINTTNLILYIDPFPFSPGELQSNSLALALFIILQPQNSFMVVLQHL